MADNNTNYDRRSPLGGVDKETYVHSANDPKLNAELTYNLIRGLKSDLCGEMKQMKVDVKDVKNMCACRIVECSNTFIRRVHPKIPLSFPEVILCALVTGILVGLGYLTVADILRIKI